MVCTRFTKCKFTSSDLKSTHSYSFSQLPFFLESSLTWKFSHFIQTFSASPMLGAGLKPTTLKLRPNLLTTTTQLRIYRHIYHPKLERLFFLSKTTLFFQVDICLLAHLRVHLIPQMGSTFIEYIR